VSFGLGDRVRWATTDEDGLPVVRYGFVGGAAGERGPVVVMLDGELAGEVIDLEQLEPVTITNVELHLDGPDLIDDPNLRRGLVRALSSGGEQYLVRASRMLTNPTVVCIRAEPFRF
jgi:hypothetical protein